LKQKGSEALDIPEVRSIKALIRRGEARGGARFTGLADEHIHFLDMPFYETGARRKMPLGEADIQIITELMERVKPHQVYAAGDLADPHGTHRVCLDAIFESFPAIGKPGLDERLLALAVSRRLARMGGTRN
jgi:glucosamine-6-phosphate deaminase